MIGAGAKRWLIDALPAAEQVRLRYWYRRMTGRLDPELRLACHLDVRDRVVVDVGANTGVYTMAFARLGARVEAFEPLPDLATRLESAAGPRIRVHRVALGRAAGAAIIHLPRDHGVAVTGRASFSRPDGAHDTIAVRVATLDEYDLRGVALVKVDVEGHEMDVLDGATRLLARERPVLLVEIEARHLGAPVRASFERIAAWRYRGWFWDGGALRAVDEFQPERHQPLDADGEPAGTTYVNNFLFVHADDGASLARLRAARP